MSTDFPPATSELFETFEELEDWEERYEYILDLGRELPKLSAEQQTEESRVHGCMSTVWLTMGTCDANTDGRPTIAIRADSDSIIVKGLIVLLLSLYEGKTPAEALGEDPQAFFGKLGLNQHLSPNRRNGLYSMIGRVRELCVKMESES